MICSTTRASSFRRLAVLAAVAALALGLLVPARLFSQDHAKKATTELGLDDHMDAMGKAFKTLKKQAAGNSLNADSAALVVEMEEHAVIAKTMMPPNAMNMTGTQQSAFILGFRKKLIDTIGQLLQLETALIDNRPADAANLIKAVDTSMHQGHDVYKKEQK